MKKITIILATILFILGSCTKEVVLIRPEAGFYASEIEVELGEVIYFTNNSLDAVYFEWNFGDGTFSNAVNPSHIYNSSGTYTVTLTAYSVDDLIDEAYQTITVLFPTTLEIEVLEYYDEYPVANASVILYPTFNDWFAEENMIIEGFTNQNGKVVFTGLGPFVYYVDVWEANHDNYTLADEDIGWIRTQQLIPNEINRFIAWVDYYPDGKKGGERDRNRKIKSVKIRSVELKK